MSGSRTPDFDPNTGERPPQSLIDLGDGHGPIDAKLAPKSDPERKFRNAWVKDGKVIKVDMDAARKIQMDAIRAERAPMLADLDVELSRADEIDDDAERRKARKDIIAKKNALREITKDGRIAKAKTPEELAELTLETLLK